MTRSRLLAACGRAADMTIRARRIVRAIRDVWVDTYGVYSVTVLWLGLALVAFMAGLAVGRALP